jgi:hypothetical protein
VNGARRNLQRPGNSSPQTRKIHGVRVTIQLVFDCEPARKDAPMFAEIWLLIRKAGLYLLGEDAEPSHGASAHESLFTVPTASDDPDVLGEVVTEHVESVQRSRAVLLDDSARSKRKFVGGGLIDPVVDEVDHKDQPRPIIRTRTRK